VLKADRRRPSTAPRPPRRDHHYDEEGADRQAAVQHDPASVHIKANSLGSGPLRSPDALAVSLPMHRYGQTALVTSSSTGADVRLRGRALGRHPLSSETDASVSGAATRPSTTSRLDQERAWHATQYRVQEQSFGERDQELSNWIHLSANTNVIFFHSDSSAGLRITTTRGTSPYLVFPLPELVDLQPTQQGDSLLPSDFPLNPSSEAIRSRPFSF